MPDRQLITLIASFIAGLGGSDPAVIMRQFYPELANG